MGFPRLGVGVGLERAGINNLRDDEGAESARVRGPVAEDKKRIMRSISCWLGKGIWFPGAGK